MLVLLPPSKTMRPEGQGPPWEPAGPLADQRAEVASAYVALSDDRRRFGEVVEASGDLLDDAVDQARGLRTDPTAPAGLRYTGQLHLAAAYDDLPTGAKERYAHHVRILSGLLGVVAPDDLVPRYRLPMGADLPGPGRLAAFWRAALTSELERQADGGLVWDLLSAEYRAALGTAVADLRLVQVRFEQPSGRAAHAVVAKQLKGALARHLSDHADEGMAAARGFRGKGYRFAEERDGDAPMVVYRPPA